MAVTRQDLIDWVQQNEETIIGQLVLYHAPVDLAHVILHPNLWDDKMVEKIKLRMEKSEGILDVEKQRRKKIAAAKPKPKVQETDEEAEARLKAEKAAETEALVEQKQASKFDDGDFALPDDDWQPGEEITSEEPSQDFSDTPF